MFLMPLYQSKSCTKIKAQVQCRLYERSECRNKNKEQKQRAKASDKKGTGGSTFVVHPPHIKHIDKNAVSTKTIALLLYAGATDGTSRRLPLHRTAKVGILSETAKEIFKKYLFGNFSRLCQHFRKFCFFNDCIAITLH